MKVLNNELALTPFESTDVKAKNFGGFAVMAQRVQLSPLKVVYGNGEIKEGQTVYVMGDACKHPFASQIFEVNGKQFILVPLSFVKMVE